MPLEIDTAARRGGDQPGPSVFEFVFLLALPGLSFWLMHFKPVMQNGFLDPYIYTGYINNFVDLFERYGVTYYGVRFGTIVPGQIATAIFGPIAGYFVLRYLLALVVGVPFYVLIRQQYGRRIAVAAVSLLLTSPFLARALLWDYPDATGVPFAFAAICLFSLEHRRRRLLDGLAGACAAMALNSNVFAVLPMGMYLGAYLLLSIVWKRGTGAIVRRLLLFTASVVAVSALGAAYYWVRVGHADIFSITLSTVLWLTGGAMADWRAAGNDWVTRLWWVLAPVYLLVLALLTWPARRVSFQEAVYFVSAAGTILFYYVYQFLLNGTFLQLFYYFSYTLPAVFLLLTLVVVATWERLGARVSWTHVGVLLAAGIGPWILHSFEWSPLHDGSFSRHLATVGLASVVLCVATRIRPARLVTSLLATAAIGVILVSSFAGPGGAGSVYSVTVNSRLHPDHLEMDVYRVALQFIDSVPRVSERPGVIRFWYSNEPASNPMQSIQSTYLWGYSKVQKDGPGLPRLEESDLETIRQPRLKWLGLLAETPDQLTSAKAALRDAGVRHATLDRRVLNAGAYNLYVELLDLQKDR